MRSASVADIPAMVDLLAKAFEFDPYIAWFGNPKDRAIARGRRQALEYCLCHSAVSCERAYLSDDGKAAALWQEYGKKPRSLGFMLANLGYFLRCGLSSTIRSVGAEAEAARKLPAEPHLFLWTIGVDPEARGRGQFRELLSPLLEEADSARVPVFLETTVERNVSIYERHGFTLVERYRYRDSPEIRLMRREPGTAAAVEMGS